MKAFASSDQIRKRLIMANIEHDIDIFSVFKVPVEAHHILMTERPVNFDLGSKLLASFSASQVSLGNYFQSPCFVLVVFSLDWFDSFDFVTLGKASLRKFIKMK